MAKLPRKVPVRYIGTKDVEENRAAGPNAKGEDETLTWTPERVLFVTREQAGRLLYYATQYKDARTEDDKKKHGPIPIIEPRNPIYDEDGVEEGRDTMPLIDVKSLDAPGLVHYAGTYLGKRLDADTPIEKLREQVNTAIQGMQYEWA